MFSSDSSDDEELQRIREAADCDFINDAMYSNGGRLSKNSEVFAHTFHLFSMYLFRRSQWRQSCQV